MGRMLGGRTRWVVAAVALLSAALASTAFAAFGSLSQIDQEKDGVGGVDGLSAAEGLAVSPDGANLYVAGQNDSALTAFARDSATGGLSFIEFEKDGVNGVDGINVSADVAVSPNGLSVYATGANDNAVATFSRFGGGQLSFVDVDKDSDPGVDGLASPRDVEVSPDGENVYVASIADFAVSVFSRDAGNGSLTYVESEKDGVGGVDGIAGAIGIGISPDGANVYVTGPMDNAVATFSRDSGTGALDFVEFDQQGVGGVDGLVGADGAAVSPDGAHVYVSSFGDAVATFVRDPATGALSFASVVKDNTGGVDGIDGAGEAVVSPDGAHVYVPGSQESSVATFSRDPASGALTFVDRVQDGVGGVDGLGGTNYTAISPDGAHVYASGRNDNSVAAFAREGPATPGGGTLDADPPETTIAKGPKKKTKKRKAKFEFASDEAGSSFQCSLDGAAFAPCGASAVFKVKRKRHTLEVRAVDASGNADPTPASATWKVRKKRR